MQPTAPGFTWNSEASRVWLRDVPRGTPASVRTPAPPTPPPTSPRQHRPRYAPVPQRPIVTVCEQRVDRSAPSGMGVMSGRLMRCIYGAPLSTARVGKGSGSRHHLVRRRGSPSIPLVLPSMRMETIDPFIARPRPTWMPIGLLHRARPGPDPRRVRERQGRSPPGAAVHCRAPGLVSRGTDPAHAAQTHRPDVPDATADQPPHRRCPISHATAGARSVTPPPVPDQSRHRRRPIGHPTAGRPSVAVTAALRDDHPPARDGAGTAARLPEELPGPQQSLRRTALYRMTIHPARTTSRPA